MRVRVGNFPQSKRKTSTKVGVFLCPQTSRPDHQGKITGLLEGNLIPDDHPGKVSWVIFQYKRKTRDRPQNIPGLFSSSGEFPDGNPKHSWVKKCEINLEILRTEKHSWVTLENRRKNSPRHFTGLTSQESFLIFLDFFKPPNLFVFFFIPVISYRLNSPSQKINKKVLYIIKIVLYLYITKTK